MIEPVVRICPQLFGDGWVALIDEDGAYIASPFSRPNWLMARFFGATLEKRACKASEKVRERYGSMVRGNEKANSTAERLERYIGEMHYDCGGNCSMGT